MLQIVFVGLAIIVVANFSAALEITEGTNRIQWIDCASNVPVPLQNTGLPSTLPSTLHCGRLDVPMDYNL